MLANHVFWRLMLFNTHLLLLLQHSVLWLSIVSFNNDAKPPPKWILREFDVSRIRPRPGGLPHLERLHGKIWPRLRGLPGLADRATRLGGSPHLSCRRDQIKMRDHMDRRVTPPKRVPSPTWGPTGLHVNRPLNIVIHKQGSWVSLKFTNKQPTRMWHFFSHVRDEHI